MFPNFISYLLVNHTQRVKPLNVSEEECSNESSYISPYVAHDPGARDDTTFGEKCPWLPHHNQQPEVNEKLHEILPGHLNEVHKLHGGLKETSNKRRALGDNFLKRKEIVSPEPEGSNPLLGNLNF